MAPRDTWLPRGLPEFPPVNGNQRVGVPAGRRLARQGWAGRHECSVRGTAQCCRPRSARRARSGHWLPHARWPMPRAGADDDPQRLVFVVRGDDLRGPGYARCRIAQDMLPGEATHTTGSAHHAGLRAVKPTSTDRTTLRMMHILSSVCVKGASRGKTVTHVLICRHAGLPIRPTGIR